MTLTREKPSPKQGCHACEAFATWQVEANPEREGWNPMSTLALCDLHRRELGQILRRER